MAKDNTLVIILFVIGGIFFAKYLGLFAILPPDPTYTYVVDIVTSQPLPYTFNLTDSGSKVYEIAPSPLDKGTNPGRYPISLVDMGNNRYRVYTYQVQQPPLEDSTKYNQGPIISWLFWQGNFKKLGIQKVMVFNKYYSPKKAPISVFPTKEYLFSLNCIAGHSTVNNICGFKFNNLESDSLIYQYSVDQVSSTGGVTLPGGAENSCDLHQGCNQPYFSLPDNKFTVFLANERTAIIHGYILTKGGSPEKYTEGSLTNADIKISEVDFPLFEDADITKIENNLDLFIDGLKNGIIFIPSSIQDTDKDGMPDSYEISYGLDPKVNDAAQDKDGDGLTNIQEFQLGTDPTRKDTDGDYVQDNLDKCPITFGDANNQGCPSTTTPPTVAPQQQVTSTSGGTNYPGAVPPPSTCAQTFAATPVGCIPKSETSKEKGFFDKIGTLGIIIIGLVAVILFAAIRRK